MRLGIFAKTFPGADPATVMAAAAGAGYDGVQYNMACSGLAPMPDRIGAEQALAVSQAAEGAGLAVFAVSGTYNMIHPDPAVREAGQRRLAVLAAACGAMGTGLITLCTGTRDVKDQWRHHAENGSAGAWRDLLASFAVAVGIAETHGVMLGVEPEPGNVVNSAQAADRLVRETGSERIGIVLDPANLFEAADGAERKRLVEEAVGLLGDRIVMAHAKDRDAKGGVVAAGRGVIDFDHFIGRLHGAGFRGPLVTHGLEAGDAAGVAAFLRERVGA